jgi:hypothetical protein
MVLFQIFNQSTSLKMWISSIVNIYHGWDDHLIDFYIWFLVKIVKNSRFKINYFYWENGVLVTLNVLHEKKKFIRIGALSRLLINEVI